MKKQNFLAPHGNGSVLSEFSLRILSRDQINTPQWNDCIKQSLNETPMAYSWVLDFLAPDWKGLVIGDYEGVMPLNIRSKWGYQLIQMPYDTHNLDIFSSLVPLTEIKHQIFFHPVFSTYRFISYSFLPYNNQHPVDQNKPVFIRNTYELSLNADYSSIFNNFTKSHKKNVRRFLRNNLTIEKNMAPHSYKTLQQAMAKEKTMLFSPQSHNANFSRMIQTAVQKNRGELLTIAENNVIIGSCFFLFGEKRILVFHISNATGRQKNTTFGLVNHFLENHSGLSKTLDFAGSDIESIALFNKGFGARLRIYPAVYQNYLPWLMRTAKETHIEEHFKRFRSKLKP
jgi:hypothetical protein